MQKVQWLDEIGTVMPDGEFDASAGFDEQALLKAENARLRAENEALKRQLLHEKLERRALDTLLDQVQERIRINAKKISKTGVVQMFHELVDLIESTLNPITLARMAEREQQAA